MKKLLSLILSVILCMSAVNCFAAYEEHSEFDISYTVPEGFVFLEKDSLGTIYQYDSKVYEALFMYVLTLDGDVNMANTEALRAFCDAHFSDENLADELAESNDAEISIIPNVVTDGRETHGGVEYYKYHKQYTAKAEGYYDAGYSVTAYVANPNDHVYMFVHDRTTGTGDHPAEIAAFLNSIKYAPGAIKIVINGERIYPDSDPKIVNDRTMVPIRAVAEKMGFEVSWDSVNYVASVKNPADGGLVNYKINSDVATKSTGGEIKMDVAPFISEDRTYLPLRAVAESLGAQVEWLSETRTVNITY